MNTESKLKSVVSDKAYPIPIEMRPLWRICLILISIMVVSKDKKYLDAKKTNILVWMLIRNNRWFEYESYLVGTSNDVPLVSVDTATYKAVEFSIAKDFITLKDGRLHITNIGEELYETLIENEIMGNEIRFLKEYGTKLTSSKVKGLTGKLL